MTHPIFICALLALTLSLPYTWAADFSLHEALQSSNPRVSSLVPIFVRDIHNALAKILSRQEILEEKLLNLERNVIKSVKSACGKEDVGPSVSIDSIQELSSHMTKVASEIKGQISALPQKRDVEEVYERVSHHVSNVTDSLAELVNNNCDRESSLKQILTTATSTERKADDIISRLTSSMSSLSTICISKDDLRSYSYDRQISEVMPEMDSSLFYPQLQDNVTAEDLLVM